MNHDESDDDDDALADEAQAGAPINPILLERAAAATLTDARLDAEVARAAREIRVTSQRLFFAIMLPPAVVAPIAALADQLAKRAHAAGVPIRFLPPADYHLTLRYLGPTPIELTSALIAVAEEVLANRAPLTLQLGGLGAFASTERAKVVWLGITAGNDELAKLASDLETALQGLGITPSHLAFSAHVTLGRLAQERSVDDIFAALAGQAAQVFSKFDIGTVDLVESLVKSNDSNYRIIRRLGFKQAENPDQRQTSGLEPAPHTAATGRPALPDTDDGWPRGQGPGEPI